MGESISLEKRIFLLTDKPNRHAAELCDVPRHIEVDTGHCPPALDILPRYEAIIIEGQSKLEEFCTTNQSNVCVPVLFAHEKPISSADAHDLVSTYNLFKVADEDEIDQALLDALSARAIIRSYLEQHPRGKEILSRQDPPKFRKALVIAEEFVALSRRVRTNIEEDYRRLYHDIIVPGMLKYDQEKDPAKREEIARTLDPHIETLMETYGNASLNYMVRVLGEGESGEATVGKVEGTPRGKNWIFRIVEPRAGFTAEQLAEQRHLDAAFFSTHPQLGFSTAYITAPFVPKKYNGEKAFVLMEYIEGEPLWRVLDELNSAHSRSVRKELVDELRNTLIHQALAMGRVWVHNKRPLVPAIANAKPSPKQVQDYYYRKLKGTPENFERRAGLNFLDPQSATLWQEATRFVYRIRTEDSHVVRNRDLSHGNILIGPNEKPTVTQLLSQFSDETGAHIDPEKVRTHLHNIDLKECRWAHSLEDVARLVVQYGTNFLLYDTSDANKPKSTIRAKAARQRVYDLAHAYVRAIGQEDLVDDKLTLSSMLLFRTLRDLNLFTGYWQRTCDQYGAQQISKTEYEDRRERFTRNIKHYCFFAPIICTEVARFERKDYLKAASAEDAAAVRPVLEEIQRLSAKQAQTSQEGEQLSSRYLAIMNDPALPEPIQNIARVSALRSMVRRIAHHFDQEKEPLKYCPSHS
ncbi:hypothetical protein C4580_00745 [Candidatus Woesearchaeota archaeon]|nr:MAG: hypothetical protein C4580_00745 [Candidatus Woesearchaeota archaeon]